MIVLTSAREINAAVKSNTYGASRGHRRGGHVYCQAPGHTDALRVIGARTTAGALRVRTFSGWVTPTRVWAEGG